MNKTIGTIFLGALLVISVGSGDINLGGVVNRAWGGFVGMINGLNGNPSQTPNININIPQSPNDRDSTRGYEP